MSKRIFPHLLSQTGIAHLALVVFLLFGIAAGTLLVQNGVNFLPNAANQPTDYSALKAAVDQLPADSGVVIVLPDSTTITKNISSQLPAFSVIKLWIAGAALKATKDRTLDISTKSSGCKEDKTYRQHVNDMIISSDNDSANCLIDKLTMANINRFIQSTVARSTVLGRKMLQAPPPDNLTTAADASAFMQYLKQDKIGDADVSADLRSILGRRSVIKNDLMLASEEVLNRGFEGKSGTDGNAGKVRNNVGTFVDASGKQVYFAILVPSDGKNSEQKIINILQLLYKGSSAVAAPAAPPAGPVSTDKLDKWDTPNDTTVRIKYNTNCTGNIRYWQIRRGQQPLTSGEADCNKSGRPCIGLQNEPACPSSQCRRIDDFIGECVSSAPAAVPATAPAAPGAPTIREGVGDTTCGVDQNNRPIPCYIIGVFSPAELAKIEHQADLATINYGKYITIMDQQSSRIKEKISENQQAQIKNQIAQAEAAAKACLPK